MKTPFKYPNTHSNFFHLHSSEYCGFIVGGHEELFTINISGTLIGRDPGPEGIVHPSPKNPSNMIWASGSRSMRGKVALLWRELLVGKNKFTFMNRRAIFT